MTVRTQPTVPRPTVKPNRGVYATPNDFPGMTEIRVFDSRGRLRLKATVASEDLDRQILTGFEHWLNRKDPVVQELRAV